MLHIHHDAHVLFLIFEQYLHDNARLDSIIRYYFLKLNKSKLSLFDKGHFDAS